MGEKKDLLAVALEFFESKNWWEAEHLYRRAIQEAGRQDEQHLIKALHMLAFTLIMKKEFIEAISIYEKLLGQTENNTEKAIALHQLGMIYRMEGRYEKAIELFSREKIVRESSLPHDFVGLFANAYEFGVIALEQDQHKQAFNSFTQTLKYGELLNDLNYIARAQQGLAACFVMNDNFDSAVSNLTSSIATFSETGGLQGAKKSLEILNELFN